MKRTLILLLILAAVIGGAVYFATQKSDENRSFEDYEGNFAVENIKDVNRVVITKGREKSIELKKTADGWFVNNKYPARMSSIKPLLDAIKLVDIKYIPPKAAEKNILWDITSHGIQVDVYDAKNSLLKSYYVGSSNSNESGTHILMNGSSQPFVVQLPTMNGSIRPRFTLTESDWRDRRFIDFKAADIESVVVEYPKQPAQSFKLTKGDESYNVVALHPELHATKDSYRNGASEAYLRELTNAACESFKNDYTSLDSVRAMVPFSASVITFIDDRPDVKINIYPLGVPVYSEFTGPIHRLFIDVRPGDFVGAQYQVIKGFLKGYDFFFDGPEEELLF